VISDASGQYIATVSYGLSGKITPARDGYEFTPQQITFQRVTEDLIFQNFEAKEILIQIAGSVNLPEADKAGVQMQGLVDPNGSIVMTDERGRYQVVVPYGWFGEVSPSVEGYTFTPSSKIYENVTRDRITENYSASRIKHTISGRILPVDQNVDVADIVLEGFPARVTTNPIGEFSTQVPFDWSNKVTPRKDGLAFNPAELEYFGVRMNMENQDFTASVKMYSISGRISSAQGPVEGVTVMTGLGSDIASVTDMDGRFELIVPHGWAGQVTFVDQGHEFNPPHKPMPPVTSDQTLNVSASVKKFKILGEIVINNEPVPGVAITATNGGSTDMTNSRGQFMVEVPYGWTGDLIPTKEGWEFDPPSKAYLNVMEDINERAGGPAMPLTTLPDTSTEPTPPVEIPSPFEEPDTGDSGTDTATTTPDPNEMGGDTTPSGAEDSEMAAMRAQIKALQDRLSGQIPDAASGDGGLKDITPANVLTPEGEGAVISSIYDGDLSIVLQDLAADAAVTIVADPEIQGQVSVDFSRGVRLEKALDTLLAGSGYDWRKTPYYYLVSSVRPEDVSFLPGSETRRVKLAYLQGSVATALLSTSFRQYVQADPTGRVVSVTGPRTIVERIVKDLEAMDIRPRQVLLDARIVTMEKGDLLNIGVEWGFPQTSIGMFSNNMKGGGDPLLDFGGASPWGIQIGYSPDATFTEALTMQLNLMVENEEAKIVANPQVMAQDSKPAEIRVVREEYYMMTDLTGLNSGLTFASRAELEKVESGTILEITPYISDANEIVLVLAAELSDSVPSGRETGLPVVTRRSTRNEVIVKDGGTVAIAGLQQHKTLDNNTAVPGLSKIPLLGKLFQNDNNTGTSREIAVFVTARLIPEHTQLNRYMQQQPTAAAQAPLNLSNQQPAPAYPQPATMQMPGDDFQADLMNQLRQPPRQ
jgi:Flp pilus assembly secretin CpaC